MPHLPPASTGRPWSCSRLFLFALALGFSVFAPSAEAARGRPYINAAKTTFVADNGQLLRGAIISTETGAYPTEDQLKKIKEVGLNAVHCYAERRDYSAAGARYAAVDLAVQRTRDADLYLIITIGGGGFDADFNKAFWNFYAPRYANETHVLYEIQNEPTTGNPPYYDTAGLMEMELSCYGIIRDKAPATPVMFMSYSSFENSAGVLEDIDALGPIVDWSNACIAFHGYGENVPTSIRACLEAVLTAGYPCFQTEFYRWPWGTGNFGLGTGNSLYQDVDQTGDLERLGVSWLSFLTLGRVTTDARFKTVLNNGGVAWAPDSLDALWPVPGRAVYGNSGEPRLASRTTTVRIQAEDFDVGGEGVAYHDLNTANNGGVYRATEGVDLQSSADAGGGYNIGWVSAGEWLEYTTIIRDAGLYNISLRVASLQATNGVRVKLAGVDLTGTWTFDGTGAYQTWTTISRTLNLRPGQQVLRIEPLTSNFNLNWIEIAPVATGILPAVSSRILARSTGKAVGVVAASTSNGAKLEQAAYTAAASQRWTLTHRGANQYTVTTALSGGRGIDEAAGDSLSGDTLSMWGVSGSGSTGQRWIPTATDSGYYKLINARTGLAMEITSASTADGARIQVWEYAGGTHQQWAITAPVLVSIAAADAEAGGIEGNTGQFTVTRDVVQSSALTVPLTRGGTAVSGVDFSAIPTSVTIPANAARISFTVSTIPGQLPSQDRAVIVAPASGSSYGIGLPASATVTIRARDAFAQWVADHFSATDQANTAVSGPLATPFGDGVANLLRAALNVGAGEATSSMPAVTVADGCLTLTYRQLSGGTGTPGIDYTVGGIAYVVDVCTQLGAGSWQSGASLVEQVGSPQTIDAKTQLVTVRMKTPLAEQPLAFMRLRAVRAMP